MKISQFTFEGITVDLTYNKGFVAYTFEKDGQPYGNKVKTESHKTEDIMGATALLVLNFIETKQALNASI